MQKISTYALVGLVLAAIIGGVFYWSQGQKTKSKTDIPEAETSEYTPVINSSDFVSLVDNKHFTLKPGTKFTYENKQSFSTNKTDEGLERIEVVVTDQTKQVMGVKTTIVWDRVWLNNELIEDTRDWYAQDKDGNVWYFGEDVDNYENGKLKDHLGAWEAGVDGAKPGIVMLVDPKVGDSYRQEYYKGKAEDMGDIVALDKKVTVPYGTFENCLQTRDWSMIDKSLNEYKYYCADVGFVVMEESVSGGQERVGLISVFTR